MSALMSSFVRRVTMSVCCNLFSTTETPEVTRLSRGPFWLARNNSAACAFSCAICLGICSRSARTSSGVSGLAFAAMVRKRLQAIDINVGNADIEYTIRAPGYGVLVVVDGVLGHA